MSIFKVLPTNGVSLSTFIREQLLLSRDVRGLLVLVGFQLVGSALPSAFLLFTGQGEEVLISEAENRYKIRTLILLGIQLTIFGGAIFSTASIVLQHLGQGKVRGDDNRVRLISEVIPWILLFQATLPVLLVWFGAVWMGRIVFFFTLLGLVALSLGLVPRDVNSVISAQWARTVEKNWTSLILFGLLYSTITFVAIVIEKVYIAQAIGPVGVLIASTTFWMTTASILLVYFPMRAGWPALVLPAILCAIVFSSWVDNHKLRLIDYRDVEPAVRMNSPEILESYTLRWLESKKLQPGQYFPVFVVAAAGGGIRAAQWTALTLAEIELQSHGKFSEHLFAISGVSGGSLGGAAFVAGLADQPQRRTLEGMAGLKRDLKAFLSNDFLSPLLAHMLMPDALQRFLPLPIETFDRSLALERAWESNWKDVFHTDRFSRGFLSMYAEKKDSWLPLLFLNSTQVETGNRFIFAPLNINSGVFVNAYSNLGTPRAIVQQPAPNLHFDLALDDIPLSAAIHASARFTYMSPPARLDYAVHVDSGLNRLFSAFGFNHVVGAQMWGRVVDGGYFENSGAVTANEIVEQLEAAISVAKRESRVPENAMIEVHVIVISNDPSPILGMGGVVEGLQYWPARSIYSVGMTQDGGILPLKAAFLGEFAGPIEALLSTRTARGWQAVSSLYRNVVGHKDYWEWGEVQQRCPDNGSVDDRFPREKDSIHSRCAIPSERFYGFTLALDDYFSSLAPISGGWDSRSQFRDPALGWSLSHDSMKIMDERLAKHQSQIAQINLALNWQIEKQANFLHTD